jgi:hypothetical protein
LDGEGELDEIAPQWLEPETLEELFRLSESGASPACFNSLQARTWQGLKENAYRQMAKDKGQDSRVCGEEKVDTTHILKGEDTEHTSPKAEQKHAECDHSVGQVSVSGGEPDVASLSSAEAKESASSVSPNNAGREAEKAFTSQSTECKQELLEFFEDSPMFRKKIADFDTNACNLAGYLEDIIR